MKYLFSFICALLVSLSSLQAEDFIIKEFDELQLVEDEFELRHLGGGAIEVRDATLLYSMDCDAEVEEGQRIEKLEEKERRNLFEAVLGFGFLVSGDLVYKLSPKFYLRERFISFFLFINTTVYELYWVDPETQEARMIASSDTISYEERPEKLRNKLTDISEIDYLQVCS